MSNTTITADAHHHDAHHADHPPSHSVFGFWLYLMTDCIIFASLFAVFAVMSHQFAGGPTGKDLFEIPGVALETTMLLFPVSRTVSRCWVRTRTARALCSSGSP